MSVTVNPAPCPVAGRCHLPNLTTWPQSRWPSILKVLFSRDVALLPYKELTDIVTNKLTLLQTQATNNTYYNGLLPRQADWHKFAQQNI